MSEQRTSPAPGARRLAERLAALVERRHRVIVALALAAGLAAGLSLLRVRLDVDLVSMLPRGRPAFAAYRDYVERFGARDLAFVLVRAPDRPRAIAFGEAFARALGRSPEVAAVRVRLDLDAFRSALVAGALPRLLPLSAMPEVARRLEPAAVDATAARLRSLLAMPGAVGLSRQIAADPLGLSEIVARALAESRPDGSLVAAHEHVLSADGRSLLLVARPAVSELSLASARRLEAALEAARRAARDEVADPGVEIAWTGPFAYAIEDAALLRRDLSLYSAFALACVLAVFLAGYRDLRILPFVTAHIAITTLVTLALGSLAFGRLNAISLSFAAIFYGLSIDSAIHFYTRFVEERSSGREVPAALRETMAALASPALLAGLTTALAFATIGLSELAGVAQLGLLTAAGLILNLPATFVVLPAWMLWLDRRNGVLSRVRPVGPTPRLGAIAAWSGRRRGAALAVALAASVLAALGAARLRLDTDLFHLRPSRSRAAAVEEELRHAFGFTNPHGAVVVAARRAGAAAEEAVLETSEEVRRALEQLREEGLVRSVTSPAPLLPSRRTQRERLRAWASLPRERAARRLERALEREGFRLEPFARALALLRSVPEPVDPLARPAPGLEMVLDRHVSRARGRLALLTPFSPRDGDALATVAARLERRLAPTSSRSPALGVRVTGRPLMERELHRTMSREIALFLLVALAGSAALVLAAERRVRAAAAVTAVPAVAVLLLAGAAGGLGLSLDPVNLVVLPLVVGIGIDDGLYLAARIRESGDPGRAASRAGRALAITTATTVAGFGVLTISRYPALAGLGALAALGLALSLASTLVLLPALLTEE